MCIRCTEISTTACDQVARVQVELLGSKETRGGGAAVAPKEIELDVMSADMRCLP